MWNVLKFKLRLLYVNENRNRKKIGRKITWDMWPVTKSLLYLCFIQFISYIYQICKLFYFKLFRKFQNVFNARKTILFLKNLKYSSIQVPGSDTKVHSHLTIIKFKRMHKLSTHCINKYVHIYDQLNNILNGKWNQYGYHITNTIHYHQQTSVICIYKY